MRNACRVLFSLAVAALAAVPAHAASLEELVSAVVRIKTYINPDGQTVQSLGREREGSGIVIDEDGLVLTIGYLMVEAHAAEVTTNAGRTVPATIVGYDHETGFGLLRATAPLKLKPLAFGKSGEGKERDPVLIVGSGGADAVQPAYVVAKREFAGNWEYLLDEAIFTYPAHPNWGGTGLISNRGELIGIGSLQLERERDGKPEHVNMVVPIDLLKPVLDDLRKFGRVNKPARPWLGMYSTEIDNRIVVIGIAGKGPAARAELKAGDVILAVNGDKITSQTGFYRKLWSLGPAGVDVPLTLYREGDIFDVTVKSSDRARFLKAPRLH